MVGYFSGDVVITIAETVTIFEEFGGNCYVDCYFISSWIYIFGLSGNIHTVKAN